MPWVDEGAYWARAQEIRAGHWLPDEPFYQDPLFPYVLAVLSGLVGPDVTRLRIALACIGGPEAPLARIFLGGAGRGAGTKRRGLSRDWPRQFTAR